MRTMHWIIIGLIAIAIVLIAVTGKADATKIVTIVALALCPLMMIFMHGGHGGDKGGHRH